MTPLARTQPDLRALYFKLSADSLMGNEFQRNVFACESPLHGRVEFETGIYGIPNPVSRALWEPLCLPTPEMSIIIQRKGLPFRSFRNMQIQWASTQHIKISSSTLHLVAMEPPTRSKSFHL